MAIIRVTAEWTGFQGAPGYTNFHFLPFTGGGDAAGAREQVASFFRPLASTLAPTVTINVSQTLEVLDEQSGVLEDYMTDDTDLGPLGGDLTGSFAGPAGAVVNWSTSTINNGRRVRGRTFVVPIRGQRFDADGTLSSAAIEDLNDAAEGIRSNEFQQELAVWSRPRNGAGGVAAPVIGHLVPDMVAVLRSRRD